MRYRFRTSALAFVMVSLLTANLAAAADEDQQAVQTAVTKFHDALNTLFTGDAGPMKAVWSHAADVTYMGPTGGFQVGWKQVEPYWDKQAAKKLGGKVDAKDVKIVASPQLAVASYYEKGENVIDGKPQPVSIRDDCVPQEKGEWKAIGHHTDTLPYLDKGASTSSTEKSSGSTVRPSLRRRRLF